MGRMNPIERRIERFLREPPSVRNAAGVIVIATAAVVLGAGVVMTLIDSNEYPNLGVGLWWALQTVTTVGYGDVVPAQLGGRLVGAFVMLAVAASRHADGPAARVGARALPGGRPRRRDRVQRCPAALPGDSRSSSSSTAGATRSGRSSRPTWCC